MKHEIDDLRDPPFGLDDHEWGKTWHGERKTIDGTDVADFHAEDVADVLYHGGYGFDDYEGFEAAVLRLTDGRLVAYESWWGPTGTGFSEDAYGGDADIWFSAATGLRDLVLQALSDQGRTACGLPVDGAGL